MYHALKECGFELVQLGPTQQIGPESVTMWSSIQHGFGKPSSREDTTLVLDYNQESFLITTKTPDNGDAKRELYREFGYLVSVLFPAKMILQRVCRE